MNVELMLVKIPGFSTKFSYPIKIAPQLPSNAVFDMNWQLVTFTFLYDWIAPHSEPELFKNSESIAITFPNEEIALPVLLIKLQFKTVTLS